MSQGKARDKEKTIEALKPYFKVGCSVKKACEYGGIPQSTVQTWIDNDEALRVQVTAWQNEPNMLARTNWIAKMAKGDYNSSRDWMTKKEKDEFADRVEQTGVEGAPITVTVIKNGA